MKNLRSRFTRFCYRNQHKGIPNLMLYVGIGMGLVWFLTEIDRTMVVYRWLCFDADAILQGQIWRMFTYIFVPDGRSIFSIIIWTVCEYFLARMIEIQRGTLWFNLYYLTGLVLTAVISLILDVPATAYYLNMTLFLAYATIFPEYQVRFYFIIPLKAKYLAWAYFLITLVSIIQTGFPYNLLPVAAMLNYFLFFGLDVLGVLPDFMQPRRRHNKSFGNFGQKKQKPNVNWAKDYRSKSGEKAYRHKCTVCGRTDTENQMLEFRYCSKCNGYYCYCIDHINDHAHIQ